MYIVTAPELIQAIQKYPKKLAFPPIEAKFSHNVCGASATAREIVDRNVNGEEGEWGISVDTYNVMRAALAPGAGLDAMNRVMVQTIAASIDDLVPVGTNQVNIKLNDWLRQTVTIATTDSVYGPQNPFKDRKIADAFWDFESDLVKLLVGFLPSITARKGIAARTKVSNALERYFESGAHEDGSILVKNRYDAAIKNGFTIEDWAPYEVGGALAVLVNTAPAAFWMIFLVYADPELLADIRAEIEPIMTVSKTKMGLVRSLDITNLKESCSLMTSTFQEVLRFRSMGTSVRQVMEDTTIKGDWLLKKDAMIQMPSRVIHTDSSIWGQDVDVFNPRRFLKDYQQQTAKKPNAAAFRAFGGGTTLCPGRHFATNEVLAVVTMMVMRYDLSPLGGKWTLPTVKNTNMASVVMTPDTEVEVTASRRKGYEEGKWAFGLKDSEKIFAMVAEDKDG